MKASLPQALEKRWSENLRAEGTLEIEKFKSHDFGREVGKDEVVF